ncbi:DUF6950 family protein [Pseudoalteromonas denitrificans]|uniref:DUF6950 domain-containing protein n=1 Tax=Pseudoalteromonas denitrificans DSM 6059 TaxID=1123010 RepID=A0A1I1TIV2_9GAMM|nr:hypothetical protein [Pseudoalteromonas denitrificans]SFD55400.1 hypothetical protein SAMN02745724_04836 [Pseudoalteromonas denitrificans DSM 6059]
MNHKLNTFLAERENMPFEWGKHDCCLFVCDWILCACGKDLGLNFRGKYLTKKGAFKQLFKHGFNDVQSIFKQWLNTSINPTYTKRGDIALVNYQDELVGGIVYINQVICVGENGLVTLPFEAIECVYSLSAFMGQTDE